MSAGAVGATICLVAAAAAATVPCRLVVLDRPPQEIVRPVAAGLALGGPFPPGTITIPERLLTPAAPQSVRDAAGLREWVAARLPGSTPLLLYEAAGPPIDAARALVLLTAAGLGSRVSMRDGGGRGPRWLALRPAARHVCGSGDIFVSLAELQSLMDQPSVAVVDARQPNFYLGTAAEPGERPGHIPGAVNIPFTQVLSASGALLGAERLREIFRHAGADARIVVYCHSGRKASLVYLAALSAGLDARIYDGSWIEWSAHRELPSELGPGAAPLVR